MQSPWRNGLGGRHVPRTSQRPAVPVNRLAEVDAQLGAVRDVNELNRRLAALAPIANLVTPAEAWSDIPDGHSVCLSRVKVDPTPRAGDVYPLGERHADGGGSEKVFGLAKVALLRLGQAAGVTVARNVAGAMANGRTDDGTDPHFCGWTVTVEAGGLFGTRQAHTGDATIDLRDDSEAVQSIRDHFEAPERVLRERREYIERAAQTAALLRALRNALCLTIELTEAQLQQPFVVVVLRYDGSYASLDDRRAFRDAQIRASSAAAHALFGPGPSVGFTSEPISLRPPLPPGAGSAPLSRASAPAAAPSRPPQLRPAGAAAAAPRPTLSQAARVAPMAAAPAAASAPLAAPFGDEALLALALAKGRLGTGDEQVTAVGVTRMGADERRALRAQLEALPDAGAALPRLPPPQDTEPVPRADTLAEPTRPWGRWAPPADEPIPF